MKRKILIIVIGVLCLILVIVLFYILFFYNFSDIKIPKSELEINKGAKDSQTTLPRDSNVPVRINQTEEPSKSISQEDLKKMAASFAERFGSYSNHSNYGNITDLKIFMTDKMQAWADQFVKEEQSEGSNDYYGIITKAINAEIKSFNSTGGSASVLVKTQRRETVGNSEQAKVFYQNILIDYIKVRDDWKANNAIWQE